MATKAKSAVATEVTGSVRPKVFYSGMILKGHYIKLEDARDNQYGIEPDRDGDYILIRSYELNSIGSDLTVLIPNEMDSRTAIRQLQKMVAVLLQKPKMFGMTDDHGFGETYPG